MHFPPLHTPPSCPSAPLQAQEGAAQVLLFHQQQAAQWSLLSDSIESYLDSVRELAEKMAVDGEGGGGGGGVSAAVL